MIFNRNNTIVLQVRTLNIKKTIYLPDGSWIWIYEAPKTATVYEADGTIREIQGSKPAKRKIGAGGLSFSASAGRYIRLKNAPAYLGTNINRFNSETRPYLTAISIGKPERK